MAIERVKDGGNEWVIIRQQGMVFKIGKIQSTVHGQMMITAPDGQYRLTHTHEMAKPTVEWLVETYRQTNKVFL